MHIFINMKDFNVLFKDYFTKTEEEKDDILTLVASAYIEASREFGMNYFDMIEHLNTMIEDYTLNEEYEQADGFKLIRDNIITVVNEHNNGRM